MEKITIYTNETCPYCKQIKEELNKENIEFNEKLTKDYKEDWKNISSLTGLPNVPTIYFKNNYFVPSRDFSNAQHLINILNNFEESKFSIDKQVFEKVKTLNHNINIAFGRLDKLLREIETKINKDEHKSTD
jgi:glutaredoxin